MSQCQQFKLQVGSKDRTRIKKKPFKNIFPEKGRPVLNTVQKSLEQSSIFLSTKIWPQSDKQQGNTAALKNEGFSNVLFEKWKQKFSWWKLLKS